MEQSGRNRPVAGEEEVGADRPLYYSGSKRAWKKRKRRGS